MIGSGNEILLPGFINGHHHVGLTPVQLGSPDMPLELWFVTRMVMRNVNPYLDTLYSAFEMIASGITTVQHLHGWAPGRLAEVEARCEEVIRAYQDVGMRVSYSFSVRDQNRLVYQDDAAFVASLPPELRGPVQRWYDRFQLSLDDFFALFESLPRTAPEQEPGEDPVVAGEPALVLGCGADTVRRDLAQVQRAAAHASGRDRVSEGICAPARRLARRWSTSTASACSGRR